MLSTFVSAYAKLVPVVFSSRGFPTCNVVYYAHTQGDTVMRALAWDFPNYPSLAGTFTQFMLGPSLFITPVLIPNVESVNGVFPGIGEGTN
ncbi:hypothetical protein LTR12_008156 [Friedmanniomyces endolithicus]|nr:hypothetical protein LTR74_015255 [Friedmanniomyces endolithicus]KAK1817400.1 hypothetical protein LTR12_008156 [Friedmanniomyces endolithicus]